MIDARKVSFSPRHVSRRRRQALLILTACGLFAFATSMRAQHLSSEKDIVELRLGQRVKVDDGTCPAGQVKEISGTKMTAQGVVRTQKCIPRIGTKHK